MLVVVLVVCTTAVLYLHPAVLEVVGREVKAPEYI
jgi:hypothetical protein